MGEIVVKIRLDGFSDDGLWSVVHGIMEREGMTMNDVEAVIVDKQTAATKEPTTCEGGSCCDQCGKTE